MDTQTLGAAIAIAKGLTDSVLPDTTSADAGEMLVVGGDGSWVKGAATTAVISVSGTTLTITEPEE